MRASLLLLLMLSFPALAADSDPIDAALDACLAKPEGSSTVGMVECASQRRWVAFREAEHEAMGGPWQQNKLQRCTLSTKWPWG
jgi:uncharacterized protein YecT (DUF1311 family)